MATDLPLGMPQPGLRLGQRASLLRRQQARCWWGTMETAHPAGLRDFTGRAEAASDDSGHVTGLEPFTAATRRWGSRTAGVASAHWQQKRYWPWYGGVVLFR